MIFYEIEMLSPPIIQFSCSVESEKYRNQFYHKPNFLEISICEQGRIVFAHKDRDAELAYPGMIVPIFYDLNCDTYSYQNEKQCHTTVGVTLNYRLTRFESEADCDLDALAGRLREGNRILIPYLFDLGERNAAIRTALREIIPHHFSDNPEARLHAISRWYRLCAILTEAVYANLIKSSESAVPSEQVYIKRALQYLARIERNQPTVAALAAHLRISEGYLHRIFKRNLQCTPLEHISRQRIAALIDLVKNKNLTLGEAAANVGIDDPAYASRLFKKVMGISFRDYFAMKVH
jgi:AraC-like DNA-binding protein